VLFVDLAEQVDTPGDDPRKVFAAQAMTGFVRRIAQAELFVLDPTATEMGVNVFLSKPSSMLDALPFVKLPAPRLWIEFSNMAARAALARLGNDNQWAEGGVFIERTGFLITETVGGLVMECAARFRSEGRDTFSELLTARCVFDTVPGRIVSPDKGVVAAKVGRDTTGKARKYYDLLSTDPKEYAASRELKERFSGALHPDFVDMASKFGPDGRAALNKALEGHVDDAYRFFTLQVLPALILMNCRNAVETNVVPAPAKLNKARLKKGRPEIGPYRLLKLHLSETKRRRYETSGTSRGAVEGSLVMGHFKIRKSGVYWWSSHLRLGGPSDGGPRAIRVLTR
jgi:hypothetical protein